MARTGRWIWLLGAALTTGCFLGGQTGGIDDSMSVHCGKRSVGFDDSSRWGFSGQELLNQYGGTWSGHVQATSPPPSEADDAPQTFPVTISVHHGDELTLESDCEEELEVSVWIVLQVGDGWVDRVGEAHLVGNLEEATLTVRFPAVEGVAVESTELLLDLEGGSKGTGSLTVGNWCGDLVLYRLD